MQTIFIALSIVFACFLRLILKYNVSVPQYGHAPFLFGVTRIVLQSSFGQKSLLK